MIVTFFVEFGFVVAVIISMVVLILPIIAVANWIADRWGTSAGLVTSLALLAAATACVLVATGSGITG